MHFGKKGQWGIYLEYSFLHPPNNWFVFSKIHFGKKDNEESFWNIPFHIDPTTSLYSQNAFWKKDNEESFWNIPFYIDPTTSVYSQKSIYKKRENEESFWQYSLFGRWRRFKIKIYSFISVLLIFFIKWRA